MSDWLVALQDKLAGYPSWLVIGGGVILLAGLCMLLGKILRILGVLMFIALLAAGGWYFWQRATEEPEPQTFPATRLQQGEAAPAALVP